MSEDTSAGTCSDYLGLCGSCFLLGECLLVCDKRFWILVIAKEQREKTSVVFAASASRFDITLHA